MSEYKSYGPDVRVSGEVIQAFMGGFPPEAQDLGLAILAEHGINNPKSGEFYVLQYLFDAMKEVESKFSREMLYRIGYNIAQNAILPPQMNSMEIALSGIDVAYHMNHVGGEIGHYAFTRLDSQSGVKKAKMVCRNPYSCSFDWGVIEGFAKRFQPQGCIDILVRHDETTGCRSKGHEECSYIISWV
ncbi:MAG: hypothetical protein HY912_22565 [Desulfomonile tiedjei]|uniref:4-vinyl reductase 4VR domain-containing protein n=1 Tax=Desulfomonile tiedjei TaxID=2358 RepID=A0A9D6V7S1_9BACT|nr:hypothetical protein [Desulfomonile tiedjei]